MKLFRVVVTFPRNINPRHVQDYVDWYDADTIEEAREMHAEDMHRYGLPEGCNVEIVECDRVTLKPVN